jgi:pilus assembly protein FimV
MKKHATAQLIFAATALASQQAWALGFGRTVSDAVLGQSFSFSVPVRVEPGEHLGGDCVSAEVFYGETMVPPQSIRTTVDPGSDDNNWIVRVTSSAAVSEPIVEVTLNAGCGRRFSRRFTLFADPPTLAATPAQLAAPDQRAVVSTAPKALPPVAGASASEGAATGAVRPHPRAAATVAARPRVIRKGPTQALANELNTPAPRDNGSARKPGPRVAAAAADGSRLVLDGGTPQLKLDMEDPIIPPAGAVGEGGAGASSDLDDPSLRQLKTLEQSIQAVRRDNQSARDRAAKLQAELADAQTRGDWLPWVLCLLAIAVAAIAGLVWRLRQQARLQHSSWFRESQLSANMPLEPTTASVPARAPEPTPDPLLPRLTDELPSVLEPEPSAAPDSAFVTEVSATLPLDRAAMASMLTQQNAPRELSVEELLDLEQQADFFIALGQEDAAVDLLMSHLRSAGGQSPLPYTKLLEIYRRQGDRSAYERIRARFNRRFNAYAPDWETGPASGRSLEDYPETGAMLQNVWHSPIDAMAVLEGLLFKRDDTSELFDLPAYRDILLLYSLARDLWQHGAGSTSTQVDVLLPLDDTDVTSTMPYPSAREVNDFEASRPPEPDRLTSIHMTDFEDGGVDLELPGALPEPAEPLFNGREGSVHATLDELRLEPIPPGAPRPSPAGWDEGGGSTPDSEAPTRR